ncbi:MAG TPA: glucose 1-dehydrogenase [Acidimicrobiales bacterium]|nr:glucose 1-dehydrogenase [Acidimicrobiales bacterium]
MARLDGKVALITGAARGQGAVEARRFVEEGARVVVADVLDDEGRAVADSLDGSGAYTHLDVSSEADWAAAMDTARQAFGGLDVLVNNAGILLIRPLEQTGVDDYMRVVSVNQLGVFLGMRSAAPLLTERGGGSIVNISSVDGLVGTPGFTAYVATKFAVRGMTKAAAIELGSRGIRVNSVHPGGVDTPMLRLDAGMAEDVDLDALFKRNPLPRCGRPEDVANLVLFLASDESAYCTGSEFVVDGGLTAQ